MDQVEQARVSVHEKRSRIEPGPLVLLGMIVIIVRLDQLLRTFPNPRNGCQRYKPDRPTGEVGQSRGPGEVLPIGRGAKA
jgi:hypothetical protein